VHVARLCLPLPVPQPQRAAVPLEVEGEHEEVVGLGVCAGRQPNRPRARGYDTQAVKAVVGG
jgi:hypothetical protein